MSTSGPSSSSNSFFYVINPFGRSVMVFPFPYFTPKLFCLFFASTWFVLVSLPITYSRSFLKSFLKVQFGLCPWPYHGTFWVSLLSLVYFDLFLFLVLSGIFTVVFLVSFHFVDFLCVLSSLAVLFQNFCCLVLSLMLWSVFCDSFWKFSISTRL